ncbi:excinuclease ABC subunit B [Candidatus Fermentibacteria bacterium]|nr:MAG: excinuclease ABC subunit B [Candidatus Fermentibacteria bacterium]
MSRESIYDLTAGFSPSGDQPAAIEKLVKGFRAGYRWQTLLGVTGSGKTFTMANVIKEMNLPALVISHNKTLAAQLYGELSGFFPNNAVEYFVSYYDYYQPEAYLPARDMFIEKDASLNEELDRLRLRATTSLLSRDDVIVVASVSCLYGLGSPRDFMSAGMEISAGERLKRDLLLTRLVDMQYRRNDVALARGYFRVRGDIVDIVPSYSTSGMRVEFFGDTVESLSRMDHLTGHVIEKMARTAVFPAKHFVAGEQKLNLAMGRIQSELDERLLHLRAEGRMLEAHRLQSRTKYDLEMMGETGYCSGIENYSRHIEGRGEGERPSCLLDYFPDDYLVFIDESHRTIPQIRGMYRGDRSRKETLVNHGFRLPSALDNRPLYLEEFEEITGRKLCMSATPADYELDKSEAVVEQIVRPTGLVDPEIEVRTARGQVDDLVEQIRNATEGGGRVLITTLTKRMAEELTSYLAGLDIKTRYIHSEIDALERVSILRDLRLADFQVLVGVNLLREGLDLPEVSLVAVMDADKEGFLRSRTSLVQTAGRAARNNTGKVIFYGDRITDSMKLAMEETGRRREIQLEYNRIHGITPRTVSKTREEIIRSTGIADIMGKSTEYASTPSESYTAESIAEIERQMMKAADRLEFEEAARFRDILRNLMEKRSRR